MGFDWADSAEKHYPIADGTHAITNRVLLLERFDISPDGEIVDLVIGPARDGQPLEVFLHRRTPRTIYLFHVLHLRPKTWNRAQDVIRTRKKEALP
jgi:hypothetical protein